jgi:hypothetical protein
VGRSSDSDYIEWAKAINATFLSIVVTEKHKKLRLKCHADHEWLAYPSHLKKGHGCPKCSNKAKLSMDDAKNKAESNGGQCLSKIYKNANSKMDWQCKDGHEWSTTLGSVNNGSWCPICVNISSRQWCKQDAVITANTNNGSFLSEEFTNRGTTYLWQCHKEHKFKMSFDAVLKDRWCPKCKYKKENKVRSVLELITGKAFPQKSPSWLINPTTNGRMKFDAFNEEMKIAVEYHGEFHYKENPWGSSLLDIKKRDTLKKKLAKKHGIKLIVINYRIKNIEIFLAKRLK